jgi:hypothetical protein
MKKFLLFLSGPITGLSFEGSTDWRKYVAKNLPPHITAVSPMRGKEYLAGVSQIEASYELHPLSSQKGITCRDRMDVMRCDAILVNFLGSTKVSKGSIMEIAWADILRKPIILVTEEENIHNHPMIHEVAGFITDSLDEAIKIAIALLSTS